MTKIAELAHRRPARADARRNYDKLIGTARETFAELGTGAPLEEIARRAEVGIATLYRNFPTREALIEAIYFEEVEAVRDAARDVAGQEPWEALAAWLDRFVVYVGTKKALIEGINREGFAFQSCREVLWAAGEPLLLRAQAAKTVRSDVTIDDVLRLVGGIAMVGYGSWEQRKHVLSIALDGLRLKR
ncbi:TetR/AcrR family transcriptional regulator [Lacibacterium aquatile]|uniref:TetR/AcrR family transcriptional regulator n=1 Tax=Lacibacterium aquatile TaxID=1168082 RepID=A0ABW5DV50_9PROT